LRRRYGMGGVTAAAMVSRSWIVFRCYEGGHRPG
jgi:hypothetical protein